MNQPPSYTGFPSPSLQLIEEVIEQCGGDESWPVSAKLLVHRLRAEIARWRNGTYHPDPKTNAEILADLEEGRAVDRSAGIVEGWHKSQGGYEIQTLTTLSIKVVRINRPITPTTDHFVHVLVERRGCQGHFALMSRDMTREEAESFAHDLGYDFEGCTPLCIHCGDTGVLLEVSPGDVPRERKCPCVSNDNKEVYGSE
jgi:hypothetical protein